MIVDGYSSALPTQNRNDNPVYAGLRASVIPFGLIYFGFVDSLHSHASAPAVEALSHSASTVDVCGDGIEYL